jgi:hypothetical protein
MPRIVIPWDGVAKITQARIIAGSRHPRGHGGPSFSEGKPKADRIGPLAARRGRWSGGGKRENRSGQVMAATRATRSCVSRAALRWSGPVFPAVSIRLLTRDTARQGVDSSLEGRSRRRFWLGRRISPPLCGFAPLWSIGSTSTLPIQPRPRQVCRARIIQGPTEMPCPHTSPRPPLTQIQRLRAWKCGGERESLWLLSRRHGGPQRIIRVAMHREGSVYGSHGPLTRLCALK